MKYEKILIEQFVQNFNMQLVSRDLIDMVDKDKLIDYIINKFNYDFSYRELFNLFNSYLAKEDLKELLESMGYEFIDLEESIEEV